MRTIQNLIPLIGYANRLSVRPGNTIEFKISSECDEPFLADLIRVVCADPNPAGPGLIEHDVNAEFGGVFPSRKQPFYPGSYGEIPITEGTNPLNDFTVVVNFWPTRLTNQPEGNKQCIISLRDDNHDMDIELSIDENGKLNGMMTGLSVLASVTLDNKLSARHWYQGWISYSRSAGTVTVGCAMIDDEAGASWETQAHSAPDFIAPQITQVTVAANTTQPPSHHFNGKIESPMVFDKALSDQQLRDKGALSQLRPLMRWDFSKGISTTDIEDQGPTQRNGSLINSPTRAMTGSNWDGSEMSWKHAPEQYGAIHFHDDDIYDFQWETDFSFTVPHDLPSGVYAARITCKEHVDKIPFFVCASANKPTAKLCVLVSTFTYAIYGNHARPDFEPTWLDRIAKWNAYPWNPSVYNQYGLSTYNNHSDGSGICYASANRPLMTLRPGYITFGASEGDCSGLRHFQADSHLITWLEQNDIPYDLITDQELHDVGVEALAPYAAVTTGTHPEYHTKETLNAISQYRRSGGNFMYLGGNGFYWKISLHDQDPSLLEIRRGEGGIRAWAAEPGEYYQGFDGSYGGLWRRNGYPPQKIAGVGFSAQGTFQGSHYRRKARQVPQENGNTPDTDWIFEGINDEILGDFGLSGGGAAGFELDRVDYRLGSSDDVQIIASSEGHDDSFVLVPEEQLTHITNWPNEPEKSLLRADMIYQKSPSGGQLFATGSITFCGSLLYNNGENNISTLLKNVVQEFTK